MICIENAKVVLEDEILSDGIVLTEGERILFAGNREEVSVPENAERVDAEGLFVGPGFVDIHVHGGDGIPFLHDPLGAAEKALRHGTTTVLPTSNNLVDLDFYLESFERVRSAMKAGGAGKAIGGVYMEGPFMNPKYGANPERNLWKGEISPERYRPLVEGAGDLVKVWTVAPEREGLEPFMEYAKAVNPAVTFAVGHSEATPDQIRALRHYGITIMTHCTDATGRLPLTPGTRGVGPDEYCFLDDDMYAEMISDSCGIHVCSDMQRLILKVKGVDRVILITDQTTSKLAPPPECAHITDLSFDSKGRLAGSKVTINVACRNVRKHTGVGIREAFLMASRNPARAIGMGDEVGTLASGKKANLVFVDEDFSVKRVMLEGEFFEGENLH